MCYNIFKDKPEGLIKVSLGKEIKVLRKNQKWSQSDLASRLGVSRSAVNMWEQGERTPSIPVLKDMAKLFGVELMSLLHYVIQEKTANSYKIKEAPAPYLEQVEFYQPDSMAKIPIVGQISCGNGEVAFEEIEGYEDTPTSWLIGGQYFYLRAQGDSMTNARIFDGDLVLIRKQPEVEDGEIAAVLINDEAVLKRVYKRDDTLILQSENPNYPPKIVKKDVKILGKLKKIVINM
jgi:repressor LexA